MELLEYVIDFEKRSAIKSHVLANFVAEWTEPHSVTEGAQNTMGGLLRWILGAQQGRSSSQTPFTFRD
jgi:hypothetical protein